MADFHAALRARLTGLAAGSRVYWNYAAQNAALPYIVLTTISDPRPEHLGGYTGARVTRVQCDCFASTHKTAHTLAESVIAAVAAPGETDGVHFGRVKAEGPRDLGEDVAGTFVHRASLDLLAEHRLA